MEKAQRNSLMGLESLLVDGDDENLDMSEVGGMLQGNAFNFVDAPSPRNRQFNIASPQSTPSPVERSNETSKMRRENKMQSHRLEQRCEGVARAIRIMYEEAAKEQEKFDRETKELTNLNFKLHQKVYVLQSMLLQMRNTGKIVCMPGEVDERAEKLARIKLATHLADEELKRYKTVRKNMENQILKDEVNARRRASQQAVIMAETERMRRLNMMRLSCAENTLRSPSPQFGTPRSRKRNTTSRSRKSSTNSLRSDSGTPINFDPMGWPSNSSSMENLLLGTSNQNIQTMDDMAFELQMPPDNSVDLSTRRQSQRMSLVMSETERQRRIDNFASGADEMRRAQHRTSLFKTSLTDLFDTF